MVEFDKQVLCRRIRNECPSPLKFFAFAMSVRYERYLVSNGKKGRERKLENTTEMNKRILRATNLIIAEKCRENLDDSHGVGLFFLDLPTEILCFPSAINQF